MSVRVSFDGAPDEGTINFSVGQPSADLLPVGMVRSASDRFLAGADPHDLNYGVRQGDPRFLEALAAFLTASGVHAADPGSLVLSGGNSQALDFVCSRFTRPGDTVIVEDPSYSLALPVFRDHGLALVGVPLDGAGMDLDALERLLPVHRPTLVYTIPSFHNPTGQTMSAAKRARLVALSREHGFTVVADEVYQLLHTGAPPPPSVGSFAGEGNVISLGTFSKILAPGLRLGWMQASAGALETLLASGVLVSGGNFNHFTSHVVRQLLEDGSLATWVATLRARYAERIAAMDAALHARVGAAAQWTTPDGGYFFWLRLAAGIDRAALLAAAQQRRTGFVPGSNASCSGGMPDCLRLSFAHYGPAEIGEGIARLGAALAGLGYGPGVGVSRKSELNTL